jgi:nitroreductase
MFVLLSLILYHNFAFKYAAMGSVVVERDSANENLLREFYEGIELRSMSENLTSMPVETIISRRQSIHYGDYYSNITVPADLLSEVLWAAYGYTSLGRTVPSLFGYPVLIYVCNETSAYKYIPENQTLTIWKEGDYRGLAGGYPAPIQLYIAFDNTTCPDSHWGNAEAGNAIQNIYLMANALNLGTVCEGGTWLDRTSIHQGLGLPENEQVLYKMPLGYPLPPYVNYTNLIPTTRPSSQQLPEIQDSSVSFEDALNLISSSHEWNGNPITQQELSQVLWASYGYSYFEDNSTSPPIRHRTVPSADAYYPMKIYAANSTGVYKYIPENHTLTTIVTGDRRSSIALASGNTWASSAPLIIAVVWDDTKILTVDTTYVENGLIAQNVYLESAAWGLITDRGTADNNETAMKEALGLIGETHLHPASFITVGHPSIYFNLTITSTDAGTTDPPPGTYNYQTGSSVNVTATPSSGYSFDCWLLDGEEETENPITVIMDANHTLEAVFVDDISPEISAPVQEPPENVMAYQNVTVAVNVTETGSGLYNITLWYSLNNGTTWTPLNMTEISASIYQTTISGYENCTWVTYKIVAYDNNGNQAINDNHGYYYIYHVIPEFSIWSPIFLAFLILTFAITVYKRKSLIKHKKAPTRVQ